MKNTKKFGTRILSLLLALVMVMSFTFQDSKALLVRAAEMEATQNADASSDDLDEADVENDQTAEEEDADADEVDADDQDAEEEDADDQDVQLMDDEENQQSDEEEVEPEELYAFNRIYFSDIYSWNALSNDGNKITIDTLPEQGVLVTAKNENMKKTMFTIDKVIDFDAQTPSRVLVNAVAKRATKAKIQLFLDDETEPFAEGRIVAQKTEDDWSRDKELNIDLSDYKISGKHTVHFTFIDETTADDKKTFVLLRSIAFIHDSIPVVNLNIDESYGKISDMNGDIDHDTECYGSVSISVPDDYVNELQNDEDERYTGGTYQLDYIRGRGNSTWWATKKPYKIKLKDKEDLFNMGANKHWVLIANYYDNSLLRNRMTYWLGREAGVSFTPECISVDVYMNNEYLGNYLLCEQIRVGEDRVDVYDMSEEFDEKNPIKETDNYTGGFLLSMFPYGDEYGYGFTTSGDNMFYVESPQSTFETATAQRVPGLMYGHDEDSLMDPETIKAIEAKSPYALANEYIKNYVQTVEDAIYSEDFSYTGEDGKRHKYTELMDIDSAAAYYWFQEFSSNGDAFVNTSTYLYKEKDGKLCWGPIWDFDYVAWAATDYSLYNEDSWGIQGFDNQRVWFERLMEDPEFAEKVKSYWKETLKPAIEKVIEDGGVLDRYEEEVTTSANNNFDKWGYTIYHYNSDYGYDGDYGDLDSNYSEDNPNGNPYGPGYAGEITRLKAWIETRMQWVDANIENVAPHKMEASFLVDGKEVSRIEGVTGRPFEQAPEAPKKEGYVFAGWYHYYDDVDLDTYDPYMDSFKFSKGMVFEDRDLDENNVCVFEAKWVNEADVKPVEYVHFQQTKYDALFYPADFGMGHQYFQIDFGTYPTTAISTDLTWSSSDESVAKVDEDGYVEAVGPGEADITVTTKEGKQFFVKVYVHHIFDIDDEVWDNSELMDVELSDQYVELKPNEMKGIVIQPTIDVMLFPNSNLFAFWMNDNPEVATVENGLIIAKKPGVARVTLQVVTWYGLVQKYVLVNVVDEKQSDKPVVKPDDDKKPTTDKPTTEKPGTVKPETTEKPGNTNPQTPATTEKPAVSNDIKKNTAFINGNLKYVVTKVSGTNIEASVTGVVKKKKTVTIPATVTYEGKTITVTEIAKNAFANDKKLTKVTIGSNVVKIGSKAFYNAKKCKTVVIKSTSLKKPGSKAFKNISKKAKIQVPKKCYKKYKKWFKSYKVTKK